MEQIISWITEHWELLVAAIALLTGGVLTGFITGALKIKNKFKKLVQNATQSVHPDSPGGKSVTPAESKVIADNVIALIDLVQKQYGNLYGVLKELFSLFRKK